MSTERDLGTLTRLRDTDDTIANTSTDIRGMEVVDTDGETLGKIDGLFFDEHEQKIRLMEIASGGFLGLNQKKVVTRSTPSRRSRPAPSGSTSLGTASRVPRSTIPTSCPRSRRWMRPTGTTASCPSGAPATPTRNALNDSDPTPLSTGHPELRKAGS